MENSLATASGRLRSAPIGCLSVCDTKFELAILSMAWRATFTETLRAQAQLYKTEAGMGANRWRAQDLANLPLQAFFDTRGFLGDM